LPLPSGEFHTILNYPEEILYWVLDDSTETRCRFDRLGSSTCERFGRVSHLSDRVWIHFTGLAASVTN
jgi:hypothetical protein